LKKKKQKKLPVIGVVAVVVTVLTMLSVAIAVAVDCDSAWKVVGLVVLSETYTVPSRAH